MIIIKSRLPIKSNVIHMRATHTSELRTITLDKVSSLVYFNTALTLFRGLGLC